MTGDLRAPTPTESNSAESSEAPDASHRMTESNTPESGGTPRSSGQRDLERTQRIIALIVFLLFLASLAVFIFSIATGATESMEGSGVVPQSSARTLEVSR